MNDSGSTPAMLGPTSKDATGEDFTDAKGRHWIAVGEVSLKEVNEIDVAETEQERRSVEDYPPPGPDPRTMSREQLAEKLRPRRLVGGYEYRLEEPDFETADLILGTEGVPNTPESLGGKSAFARPKYIIGPDDRRRVDNPRFFPGSANAHLATQNCTATMIGPSTALCAAHCFYNDGWISSRSITFGANTNAPTAPFGSFLADSLTLPGAWNHPGDWDWDFAVLEFSPSRPRLGDQTGWFGTGENFNGWKTCIGYPTDKPVPSQWIKGGTFTASVGARYQHNLDIIPGDSGAGIYHNDDNRCNAIQSSQWFDNSTTPTRFWNEGRRWDSTTYNFFHTYGNWPRA
ncbi:trypsin-like serine peptidase [Mycobacterium sp. URHB0021]|jgi:V8-like Glu-specific endopeptidase